jgi:hypothetical protein
LKIPNATLGRMARKLDPSLDARDAVIDELLSSRREGSKKNEYNPETLQNHYEEDDVVLGNVTLLVSYQIISPKTDECIKS